MGDGDGDGDGDGGGDGGGDVDQGVLLVEHKAGEHFDIGKRERVLGRGGTEQVARFRRGLGCREFGLDGVVRLQRLGLLRSVLGGVRGV
jgi:hypothetical protein